MWCLGITNTSENRAHYIYTIYIYLYVSHTVLKRLAKKVVFFLFETRGVVLFGWIYIQPYFSEVTRIPNSRSLSIRVEGAVVGEKFVPAMCWVTFSMTFGFCVCFLSQGQKICKLKLSCFLCFFKLRFRKCLEAPVTQSMYLYTLPKTNS